MWKKKNWIVRKCALEKKLGKRVSRQAMKEMEVGGTVPPIALQWVALIGEEGVKNRRWCLSIENLNWSMQYFCCAGSRWVNNDPVLFTYCWRHRVRGVEWVLVWWTCGWKGEGTFNINFCGDDEDLLFLFSKNIGKQWMYTTSEPV